MDGVSKMCSPILHSRDLRTRDLETHGLHHARCNGATSVAGLHSGDLAGQDREGPDQDRGEHSCGGRLIPEEE